jgi:hypothetical protein
MLRSLLIDTRFLSADGQNCASCSKGLESQRSVSRLPQDRRLKARSASDGYRRVPRWRFGLSKRPNSSTPAEAGVQVRQQLPDPGFRRNDSCARSLRSLLVRIPEEKPDDEDDSRKRAKFSWGRHSALSHLHYHQGQVILLGGPARELSNLFQ